MAEELLNTWRVRLTKQIKLEEFLATVIQLDKCLIGQNLI